MRKAWRFVLMAVTGLWGCAGPRGGELEQRLAEAIRGEKPVDIGSLTDFAWERLYVFPPYTPRRDILEHLGREWNGVEQTGIDRSDDRCLLVFVKGGQVVRFLEFPRKLGDFAGVQALKGLDRNRAVFEIRRQNGAAVLALKAAAP